MTMAVNPAALRLVLFGMPDAGKSSLLGALAQAAQMQERQLRGRLTNAGNGLEELQRRVYDDKPRETTDEIVPYPVVYSPTGSDPKLDAVLFDCDGRVANSLLSLPRAIDKPGIGKLADAILDADGLVLVVDASASAEQLNNDFAEFARFLRLFESNRSRNADVSGLPVFLVLSKCDLLAKPGDKQAEWLERIAERQKEVEKRFKEFVDADESGETSFGSLNVTVHPTSVRRPSSAGAKEPFGVAELFREAFLAIDDYRTRARRAQRRLMALVASAVGFVALLIAGAVGLAIIRDQVQPSPLIGKIEGYRSRESATPSARLTEPLQRKIGELADIQRDPDFDSLPPDLKDFVNGRLKEMSAYLDHKNRLMRERSPSDLRAIDELAKLESRLQEALAPPAEFTPEWKNTDAELLRQKWLNDIKALRQAVQQAADRHMKNAESAHDLLQFKDRPGVALPWVEWHDRVAALIAQAAKSPHRESEPLPGSEPLPSMRSPAVTYGTAFAFRSVEDAQREWDLARVRLETLRDMSLALGLAGDGSAEKSPLKVPDAFPLDQARIRLSLLKQTYPKSAEWSLQSVPDVAAPEVRAAASASLRRLMTPAQAVVLRELKRLAPDGIESVERWRNATQSLGDAPELREWGQLVKHLQRLAGDASGEPVAALSSFVQRPAFALRFSTVRLPMPDDAAEARLRPSGPLVIEHRSAGVAARISFRREDEEVRDQRRRVTTFTFAQEGDQTIAYKPGDELFAEAILRDANNKEWKLTWLQCRSDLFRFECLSLVPRLHPANEPAGNGNLVDIRLSFSPESGIPRIPDLMPVVILK